MKQALAVGANPFAECDVPSCMVPGFMGGTSSVISGTRSTIIGFAMYCLAREMTLVRSEINNLVHGYARACSEERASMRAVEAAHAMFRARRSVASSPPDGVGASVH